MNSLMKRTCIIISLVVLLSGCAGYGHSDLKHYSEAPAPIKSNELATVYVFHYGRQGRHENITINNKNFFGVRFNTYSWVQLEPGTYNFHIGNYDEDKGPLAKVNVQAGETYYIELLISETYNKHTADVAFAGGAVGGLIMALNPIYDENGITMKLADEKYAMGDIVRAQYIPSEFDPN